MKRILVALDASPRAPAVLSAARQLAELTNTKLVLYRAVGIPPDLPLDIFRITDRSIEDVLLGNARNDLEHMALEVRPELVEKVVTTFATPWDGVCRAAREYAADLIVIGSHGYGGLDRVLGTTAAKVVNHADRNVLVIRMPL